MYIGVSILSSACTEGEEVGIRDKTVQSKEQKCLSVLPENRITRYEKFSIFCINRQPVMMVYYAQST